MALAVTAPTNSFLRKPTKYLEEALRSFSDSLTAEQRGQFQVNYNRPDPASLIQLVAQIDKPEEPQIFKRRIAAFIYLFKFDTTIQLRGRYVY